MIYYAKTRCYATVNLLLLLWTFMKKSYEQGNITKAHIATHKIKISRLYTPVL